MKATIPITGMVARPLDSYFSYSKCLDSFDRWISHIENDYFFCTVPDQDPCLLGMAPLGGPDYPL